MRNSKGSDFEREVGDLLRSLESDFPLRVKVTAQPDFPDAPRPHRADFELEYKLGGLTHVHLIECQNRNRSSQEIADKIYAVRGTSERNRYIFVYKDEDFLGEGVRRRFEEMGVLFFDFAKFKSQFIEQLAADLALHAIGLAATKYQGLADSLRAKPELIKRLVELMKEHPIVLERASKYDPGRSNPPDRAMSSG
jgi:hypothetical protein